MLDYKPRFKRSQNEFRSTLSFVLGEKVKNLNAIEQDLPALGVRPSYWITFDIEDEFNKSKVERLAAYVSYGEGVVLIINDDICHSRYTDGLKDVLIATFGPNSSVFFDVEGLKFLFWGFSGSDEAVLETMAYRMVEKTKIWWPKPEPKDQKI